MKAVVQRVSFASITIDEKLHSSIEKGFLVLVGIDENDTEEDIKWLCNKILAMRIMDDGSGKMNLSLEDTNGEIMIVSQFTLIASTKKGNRPSFISAAKPEVAIPMYEKFIAEVKKAFPNKIASGVFGADMKINLINDGPVTIIIDSQNKE